jgi:hypothetical protein
LQPGDLIDPAAANRRPTTPGFYPDPNRRMGEPFQRRFWDGNTWTDRVD